MIVYASPLNGCQMAAAVDLYQLFGAVTGCKIVKDIMSFNEIKPNQTFGQNMCAPWIRQWMAPRRGAVTDVNHKRYQKHRNVCNRRDRRGAVIESEPVIEFTISRICSNSRRMVLWHSQRIKEERGLGNRKERAAREGGSKAASAYKVVSVTEKMPAGCSGWGHTASHHASTRGGMSLWRNTAAAASRLQDQWYAEAYSAVPQVRDRYALMPPPRLISSIGHHQRWGITAPIVCHQAREC